MSDLGNLTGPELYALIADTHKQALLDGVSTRRAVADALGVTEAAALGWIRRAQRQGLIP